MRHRLEYAATWLLLKGMGVLPRAAARAVGHALARLVVLLRPRLRRAAMVNLRIAFPDWDERKRRRIVRSLVRQLGWLAGEFSQFPKHNRENIARVIVPEGYENFVAAHQRGKGVIYLTGHASAWELSSFAQALYGHPLHYVNRPIDNPRVDRLINHYRCLSGNTAVDKSQSARAILKALGVGDAVGILMDQNTSLEEGVFVDFFGKPACTTTGVARIALRTDAAVVPTFVYWDPAMRKYRLSFWRAIELARTGDEETDVHENTARFTRAIEEYARKYPDQWLWVHRRWKTRPRGEKDPYSS
jgi:KDO2-lipid IV(A) lauroyltransferase